MLERVYVRGHVRGDPESVCLTWSSRSTVDVAGAADSDRTPQTQSALS